MKTLEKFAVWIGHLPRPAAVAAVIVIWLVLYNLPRLLPFRAAEPWPSLPLDQVIPVVEWTIFIYLSVFVQIVSAICLYERAVLGPAVAAGVMAMAGNALIFWLAPSVYERTAAIQGDFWQWGYAVMWRIEPPDNCFPSIHVTVAALAGIAMFSQSRRLGAFYLVWAVVIALATLTTKQHYLLDIMAGAVAAVLAYRWVFVPVRKAILARP